MMLFLISHVRFGFVAIFWANRKHPVSSLPIESLVVRAQCLDKLGRFTFHLFDEFHRRMLFAHVKQDVNVIGNAANDDPRGIEIADGCCNLSVHACLDSVVEKGLTILGAEDQMCGELRQRLGHGNLLKQGDRVRVNMALGQTSVVVLSVLGWRSPRRPYPRLR